MWHAAVIAFVLGVIAQILRLDMGITGMLFAAAIALGIVSAVKVMKSPGARVAYGAGVPAALIVSLLIWSTAGGLLATVFLLFVAAVWVICVTILHAAKVAARRSS